MQQKSELPEGWVFVPLSDCVDILDNQRVPVNSKEREKRIGNVPYYGATGQVGWIDDFLFDEELLLLGEDGAPFFDKTKTIAYIINGKSWVNNHAHVLRAIENVTNNIFLKHYLDYFDFDGFVTGTTRYKLNQSSMKEIPIYLPPVPEQHRIASAIEAIFSHLDLTNQKLNRVLEILNVFREAVLSNMFKEFERVPFSDVVSISQNGISKRSGKEGTEFKVLRLADINNLKIDSSNPRCIKLTSSEVEKYKLFKNDLICIRVNGSKSLVGRLILTKEKDESNNWAFCDHFIRISLDASKAISSFYSYFFQTTEVREYIQENMVSSAGQNTVSQKTINSTSVPVASITKQYEIIRQIDALFAFADSIEAKIKVSRGKTEKLRQSILAKAFSGKLVEREAEIARREGRDYETAEVLIERIKAEKEKGGKKR
jgi:type I restriction enzyme S subunit